MTINITNNDWSDLLDKNKQYEIIDPKNAHVEVLCKFPEELGSGYVLCKEINYGLELEIQNYQLYTPIKLDTGTTYDHPIQMTFYISGNQLNNSPKYEDLYRSSENSFCGCGTSFNQVNTFFTEEPIYTIDIHIEPELFKNFAGIKEDVIPSELQHLFRKQYQNYFVGKSTTTAQMQIILHQILQCPYKGVVKRLYLESKIIELMALRLQQEVETKTFYSNELIKPDVLEQIYHAKNILEHNLENPPSLSELAEQVKLSHHQLKCGFRQIFGMTIFQYLHQYRLDKARQLLYESNMRIAEVANIVGYSHLGRFAGAFKKKFGISPSQCLKGDVSKTSD